MPELPEVNTFQRYFDATALNQPIKKVYVHDAKIIRNVSGAAFKKLLTGRTFVSSYRQGKYLFGDLDNGHSLLLHFGMTGDLKYYQDEEDRPKHERFAFEFGDGFRLGFDCPRKFAKIRYFEDRNAYLEEIKLGKDALVISQKEFIARMDNKKGSIKGFLLNQKNLAGVGNLYADELCYRLKIHPESVTGNLNTEQRKGLYKEMKKMFKTAIKNNATYKKYPDDWLWKWREEGGQAPDGSGVLERSTVAGRTTYHAPNRQIKY